MRGKTEIKMKFEEAMKRLEEIVEKLESGDIELEKSIELYEEGIRLSEFLNTKLEEVKKKIEVVEKSGDKLTTKEFHPENASGDEKEEDAVPEKKDNDFKF